MQNRTFLVVLRPIFGEKMKTAPPKEIGCRSCEVNVVIRPEKAFEFPIWAEKSVSISVKTFFSFLEITCFWAEKAFKFLKIPSQFLDKPCDSDSRTMKIRVKVVCSFLTLFKKAPRFFKSWLRACFYGLTIIVAQSWTALFRLELHAAAELVVDLATLLPVEVALTSQESTTKNIKLVQF